MSWTLLYPAVSCMTSNGILATPLNDPVREEWVISTTVLWKIHTHHWLPFLSLPNSCLLLSNMVITLIQGVQSISFLLALHLAVWLSLADRNLARPWGVLWVSICPLVLLPSLWEQHSPQWLCWLQAEAQRQTKTAWISRPLACLQTPELKKCLDCIWLRYCGCLLHSMAMAVVLIHRDNNRSYLTELWWGVHENNPHKTYTNISVWEVEIFWSWKVVMFVQ